MKLIVDAQLPRRLARWLSDRGHDVLHTLDLPSANATPDAEIIELACEDERIVVTKDGDFVESHLLYGRPPKLLWMTTGNTTNNALMSIMERNLPLVEAAMKDNVFVEIGHENLIIHQ